MRPGNVICGRQRSFKLKLQIAGNERRILAWFLEHRLDLSRMTRYYYFLTVRLLARRLQKSGFQPLSEYLMVIGTTHSNRPSADDRNRLL